MSAPPATPATRFHANLLGFIDLAKDTLDWVNTQGVAGVPSSLLLVMARGIAASWNPDVAVKQFIERTKDHWEAIRKKDIDFLISNAGTLFGELPAEQVASFTRLYSLKNAAGNPLLPPETLESFWKFLHSMIRIAIRDIHDKRVAKAVEVEEVDPATGAKKTKMIIKYTVEYCPGIRVSQLVGVWEVKL